MNKIRPEPIHGYVRVRPDKDTSKHVIEIKGEKEIHLKQQREKMYTFDRVFSPNSSQLEVYSAVVPQMVAKVLQGYSCFVFAYGPTKTGKSYTLVGNSTDYAEQWNEESEIGCIPRALGHILEELKKMDVKECTVRVSYLELYNEEMVDLLHEFNHNRQLRIMDDPEQKKSVFIEHLTAYTLSDKSDIGKILLKASYNHDNNVDVLKNHQESESHKIFTITVYSRLATLPGEEILKTGQLCFVEVGDPGYASNAEKPLQEAHTLHQSRDALFKVINALEERHSYIPYKDSKLTRILQVGLGGHGKTSFIATVNPQFCYLTETTSTLDFLKSARKIINNVEISKVTSKTNVMKCLEAEIQKLRKDLQALRSGSGFYVDATNWSQMQEEDVMKKIQISSMTEKISEREDALESLQSGKELKIEEWNHLNHNFRNLQVKALENKARMVKTEKSLQHLNNVTELYENTVKALSQQNQELFELVLGSVQHLNALEERHKFLLEKTKENYGTAREFFQDLQGKLDTILAYGDQNVKQNGNLVNQCKAQLGTLIESINRRSKESIKITQSIESKIRELMYITNCQTIVQSQERKRPLLAALQDCIVIINSVHKSLTERMKTIARDDSSLFIQKLDDINRLHFINTNILQMVEKEKQSNKSLESVITDCLGHVSKDDNEDDDFNEIASNLQRLMDKSAKKQEEKGRLRNKYERFFNSVKAHQNEASAKETQFSDLFRKFNDHKTEASMCKKQYSKPLPVFTNITTEVHEEILTTNSHYNQCITEKSGEYSNQLVALDADLRSIVKALHTQIYQLSKNNTNETVNISKKVSEKLSDSIENFTEISSNIETTNLNVHASFKKLDEIAKEGADHFKSVESIEEKHDYPQKVLQEAAGISTYKVEEIENVKGKVKMLKLDCKEKENKDPNSTTSQ